MNGKYKTLNLLMYVYTISNHVLNVSIAEHHIMHLRILTDHAIYDMD